MKKEILEKIYAGWLAKIIGIRLGAPIEGWTYEKINNIYGELTDYPVDYKEFAADDDSNGPLFFLRSLEDKKHNGELTSQDIGEALLNYAPFEHGFFWWGGYGVSTEHTSYLNLRNGIEAPQSGSILQNGATMAEQIGGQIFIDTWGLVTPGNTDLAAKFAEKAASVTHDGNGVYGGIFISVCISHAFYETDIEKIIKKGLSYIPNDCEYAKVTNDIIQFYKNNQNDWRLCFKYIYDNYGYDKYPGNCHIIPNTAVMILSLLYGEGSFDKTLNICNMCGWDTDCNVGNIATIMGVRNGLTDIDYNRFRKPINDLLICSSVIGSLNIMDIPYGALYIGKLASLLLDENLPDNFDDIIKNRIDSCHFEFKGSTHAIRLRCEPLDSNARKEKEYFISNTNENAFTGERSLKFLVKPVMSGENIYVYKKTYYKPDDFDDSRYDPSFSPIAYPGQTLHGSGFLPEYGYDSLISLYVKEEHSGKIYYSEKINSKKGKWTNLSFEIPKIDGGLISEMGFCFHVSESNESPIDFVGLIDDLYVDGSADYSILFEKETEEVWNVFHKEISQFTKLKGLTYLQDGLLHLSSSDFAEMYTGKYDWTNYTATFYFTPLIGENHMINARVQGGIRSYSIGLLPNKKVGILKNDNGYIVLDTKDFNWNLGQEYKIQITVKNNIIEGLIDDKIALYFNDNDNPYLYGSIGMSIGKGCHSKYRKIIIRP